MGRRISLALALVACGATAARAAEYTWQTNDANWMTTTAWDPDYAGSGYDDGDTFTINSGTAVANGNIFYDQLTVLSGGTLRAAANWFGARKLVMAGGTMSSTGGDQQLYNESGSIKIDDLDPDPEVRTLSTFDVTAGQLYIQSRMDAGDNGSGNLVKIGAGTLIFNGNPSAGAGTWAGTMTIDAGRVRLENNTTSLGSGTLRVDGANLDISSFNAGTVRIVAGGVATTTGSQGRVSNLRLDGGTLQGQDDIYIGDGNTSKIWIDSASTLKSSAVDRPFYIYAELNGSGNLAIEGPGRVMLHNNVLSTTYSGTITVDNGDILGMQDQHGLSGGTVDVTSGGRFLIGSGFSNGRVNINSGGIADTTGNQTFVANLRLNGGTLQGQDDYYVGNGSTSKIWVDAASTLKSSAVNRPFYIYAELNGSNNLSIEGPGRVMLHNNVQSTTYSGTITVDNGDILGMQDQHGLSGGTVNVTSGGRFLINSGFSNGTVNVETGGVAETENGGEQTVAALRLDGGKLLSTNNNAHVGNGSSTIYVDSDSVIGTTAAVTSGGWLRIRGKLSAAPGTTLSVENATEGAGILLGWGNGTNNTSFANGRIVLDTGDLLQMENSNGLSGGTIDVDSGGTFRISSGFANGTVNVNTGGVAQADNGGEQVVAALRLDGGKLLATNNNSHVGNSSSTIFVDSNSVIGTTAAVTSGGWLRVRAKLSTASATTLSVENATAGAGVLLGFGTLNTDFALGKIVLNTGDLLQMENTNGLGGGTIDVDSGGTFRLNNVGFANGTVNVNTGGFAEANSTGAANHAALRLKGGTLRASTNNGIVGNQGANSIIYADENSTIGTAAAVTSGNWLYIRSKLDGNKTLTVENATAGAGVQLGYNTSNTSFTGGKILVGTNALVRMEHTNGLGAGTVEVTQDGVFRLGAGWANGSAVIKSGGFAEADNTSAVNAVELRLQGGTLRSVSGNNNYQAGTNSGTSKLWVDSSSTLRASTAGYNLYVNSQLNGSSNLSIAGPGTVRLGNTATGSTYSGEITIASASTLRMDANKGLSGGTVRLNTAGGIFQLGAGLDTGFGTIYVDANGTAEADNTGSAIMSALRLNGGTLRSRDNADTSTYVVGDNTTNSRIYLDQDSTMQAIRTGQTLRLDTRIDGSSKITKLGPGTLSFNTIANNSSTFSGAWDIQAGTLQVSNPTSGTWNGANLGSGAAVNVASGAFLTFSDNNSTNRWDITKDFTGAGTVRLSETNDRLVVTRNAGNTVGSLSPGGSGVTGTMTFNWNATVNTNSQLDFAKNASDQRAVWNIEAVDGLTHDKIVSNGYLQNITNVKLMVDPTVPIPETMTIYEGIATQDLSAQTFGEVVWMYDTIGTLNYGTTGTITMSNILPVLWTETNAVWGSTGTGGWDRLNPSSNTMAEIRNYGTAVVDGSRSVRNLIIKNSGSRMNVDDFGSLSATNNIDVQTGGRFDVNSGGYVSAPILTTAGTVNLNTGSSGNVTTLTVSDGTTNIGTGTSFFYTNVNVPGGSFMGGTLNFNNATSSMTSLVVGTTGQSAATATITNSTVTAGTVAVRRSNNSFAPTTLTVGTGGLLKLFDTSKYVADADSYSTGRYVLDPGGEIRFQSSIDLGTFQAQTAWNGGVLGVVSTLTNYNGRSLAANQIVDFGLYGSLDYGPTDRLYLRGGEVRFGSGYTRDARLQLTEDLGTIEVSGGALSNMPTTVPANVKLTGALATWNAGSTTMGRGTALTIKDGASVNVGSGKFLTLDSAVFSGTGGTVTLGGGTLIHGSSLLQLDAGSSITGAGNLLVGAAGVSLGNGGELAGATSTNRLIVYGDVSGSGALRRTTIYGNLNIGNSPGVIIADDLILTSGSTSTIELGGTFGGTPPTYAGTQYDRYIVEGDGLTIQSNVTGNVVWWSGFQASAGDVFQIFTFNGGSLTGTFATLNLPTFTDPNLSWNSANLYTTGQLVVISAVPEPASLALIGCGGLVALALRARRSRRTA